MPRTASDLSNAQLEALIDARLPPGATRPASAKKLRAFMLATGRGFAPDANGVRMALDALAERRAEALPDPVPVPRAVHGTQLRRGADGRGTWTLAVQHVVHARNGLALNRQARLGPASCAALDAFHRAPSEALHRSARALVDAESKAIHRAAKPTLVAWCAELESTGAQGDDLVALVGSVREHLAANRIDETRTPCPTLAGVLADALAKAIRQLGREMARRRVKAVVGYADHVERLKGSRLPRRIVFHVGPTNSGKTHDAMQALAGAADGYYLAPLRLLALEGYERLRGQGVAAGMLTGEESAEVEGATHLSMTIEMANLEREVEVAVIDEVQMLLDPDRGWAWTRAMFGLRCRVLHLCGSEDASGLVAKAAEILGETVEVVRHVRKSPLRLVPGRISLDDVQAGDAVVAFSRKDVLLIRETLLGRGYRIACVYGALSPEVRRSEAHRFSTGQADVLVATDAIGMGLNLGPLRRVVLTTTRKFDGTRLRGLRPSEIRQIAGRAGRYGHHGEGLVAVIEDDGDRVGRALEGQPDPEAADGLFFVRPEPAILDEAARETGTKGLAEVLRIFGERTVYDGSPYKPIALEETARAAAPLEGLDLPPSEAFTITNCPIDRRHVPAVQWLTRQAAIRAIGARASLPRQGSRDICGDVGGLAADEAEARTMTAYLWLARRYPENFPDVDEAMARRRAANVRIEAELAREAVARAARPSRLRGWYPGMARP